MLVTQERQVMALGCNEELSGTFNPLCIRWCDLEDFTDWTSSPTNNAGEFVLDHGTEIVAARRIGSHIAIWTKSSLYLAQFIGDPSQTFRFERVDTGCGIVGPKAVTILNQTAYWVGQDLTIRSWSPGSLPVQVECAISRDLRVEQPAYAQKIVVGNVGKFSEIWIFYPALADSATENSRYIAVSLLSGAWFKGVMARTAFIDDAEFSTILTPAGFFSTILTADTNFLVQVHEDQTITGADGLAMTWHIQSGDQYLESGRRRVMINRFVTDFEAAPNCYLTLVARQFPKSLLTPKGPYQIETSTKKIDLRASGNLVSVKFSDDGTIASMRLGKPRLEGFTMGER
jgi:hypothetical protein